MTLVSPIVGAARLLPCASLLMSLSVVPAQSVNEKEFTLHDHVDLVLLDVSVKEAKGNFLSGLKKENFQIFENGKLQTISQFSTLQFSLNMKDAESSRAA